MIQHNELWQLFSANGEPELDKGIAPADARNTPGVTVGAVHAWIWRRTTNGEIEILLQHRAVDKPTWPDHLDISVAGHIDLGETLLEGLQREAKEEVGVQFDALRLEYIFSYRNFDTGFKWVYTYEQQEETEYAFNDGEVQALKWVTLDTLEIMINAPEANRLVPHPAEYYSLLIGALRRLV
jgi:isopentenyl-diphosphate Delta-isomerase